MKKQVKPQLPKGFSAINSNGGDSWRPEKEGDSITGNLVKSEVISIPKKGKIPAKDINLYTVKTADGDVKVWESAGLRALAKVKKGKAVFIQYLGLKEMGRGKNAMRDYLVAVK